MVQIEMGKVPAQLFDIRHDSNERSQGPYRHIVYTL